MSSDINANNPVIGYQSVLQTFDITSPGFTPVRPPTNAWDPSTSSAWQGEGYSGPSTTHQETLVLDNFNLEDVDYIGLARTNLIEQNYTFTVDGFEPGIGWVPLVFETSPKNDQAILIRFTLSSYESYRVVFESAGAMDILGPIVGHVKLGKLLTLPRRVYVGHEPTPIGYMANRNSLVSDSGEYLGQVITSKKNMTVINQEDNSPTFVRDEVTPLINHFNGIPFNDLTAADTVFYSWRPGDYPEEVVYGWTRDPIRPQNQGGDSLGGRMSWSVNLECIA